MRQLKQIVSEHINPDHYEAPACVFWCFDGRFSDLYDLFAKYVGGNIDLIKIAGGAKDLGEENAEVRNYLLGQIEKSVKLHKTEAVYLMLHDECGAYGKKFENDNQKHDFYFSELDKIEAVVKGFLNQKGLNLAVKKYFANFQGLNEVS